MQKLQAKSFLNNWHSREDLPTASAQDVLSSTFKSSVQQRINHFIKRKVFFEVTTDDFKPLDHENELAQDGIVFLNLNRDGVLCHLQQMLLCRQLFDNSPLLFEQFKRDVRMREAAVITDATDEREAYRQAVITTVKVWFARYIETRAKELAA